MKRYYLWTVLDQATVSAGNFLTILLGAIYLSISDQGNFIVLLSLYFFCLVISIALVYAPTQSVYPKSEDNQNYIYTIFVYHWCLSIILALIVFLALGAINFSSLISIPQDSVIYFTTFIFLQQLADYGRRGAYVFSNASVAFCFSVFLYIPRVVALIVVQPAHLEDVLLVLVYASAIDAFCITVYMIYKKIKRRLVFDRHILIEHIRFSRNILYSAPVGWAVAYAPTLVLGFSSGPALVGILGTLRSIVGLANFFVEMIEVSVIAYLSSQNHKGASEYVKRFFRNLIFWFSISWLVFFVIIFQFYDFGISLIREDLLEHRWVFLMLFVSYALYFFGRMHILFFRVFCNTEPELYYAIASLVVALIALPLIYKFDIVGAALVYILIPFVSFLITFQKFKLKVLG